MPDTAAKRCHSCGNPLGYTETESMSGIRYCRQCGEDEPHKRTPAVDELVGIVTPRRWRVGRKVGRTIYAQNGPDPSDDDELIGVMDTPDLAALVVRSVNGE